MIDFLKLAGSAGLIYEKSIITAESIVWNQRNYMTTPLKWKVAADRLFISGINQMIYHGFPYQNPLFPYPGFCGFSTPYLPHPMNFSSNFSKMNPFWEVFPIMNEYITRCQYILQHGKTISNIAIFYSLFNYCDAVLKKEELIGGYLDENDAPLAKDAFEAHVKKKEKLDVNDKWTLSLLKLGDNLTSNGFFYAHVNEECVLNCRVKEKKILIGGAEFEALILPNIDKISLNILNKLSEIANSKIPIIFINKLPDKQPGFLNYEKNDKEIKNSINELLKTRKIHLIKENENISEFLMAKFSIKPGILYDDAQSSIYYIHKKTENSDYYFLRHSKNQPVKICIKFPHIDKVPFILDPWTGEIYQVAQYKREKEYIKMDIYFESYGSLIIEFKKRYEELYVLESPLRSKRINNEIISYINEPGEYIIKLSNGTEKLVEIKNGKIITITIKNWHLKTNIRDHLGNLKPIEMDLEELKDWRNIPELKFCSSKGVYSSKFELTEHYIQDNLKIILYLGRVHDTVVVKLNGIELQPLLVYPYKIDITSYVKIGKNNIEIEITPTLCNRLIGYGKKGGKNWKNHKKRKEFMPSGLIGPVIIKTIELFKIRY